MGLNTLELVIELEDRFETSLPDSVAEKIQTVGQLYEFLMSRIRRQADSSCAAASMFYPIRKILLDDYGIDRADVRPTTALESLVTVGDRPRFWRQVETQLMAKLPRLQRSHLLQWHGNSFPLNCSTMGQLAQVCSKSNRIADKYGPNDQEAVWREVCELVGSCACVNPSTLKPETHFARDLGF